MNRDKCYFDRFRVITHLGKGSFGVTYKGLDTISNRLVAIKVEPPHLKQLKLEAKIYKQLGGTKISKYARWPQMSSFGKDGDSGANILVMDLLGPSLEFALRKTSKKTFSPITIAYLAEKALLLLEILHDAGYVHRDLKPENFVLEYVEKSYPKYPEIFLIDYGLSKRYITDKGKHMAYAQNKSLKGTVRYSSINTHLGAEQTRRDDLESLGYILVYMTLGKLPWQNLMRQRDKKEAYHHIMVIKMMTSVEDLVEEITEPLRSALAEYLFYVKSLKYDQKPDYSYCRHLFKDISSQFKGNLFKDALD